MPFRRVFLAVAAVLFLIGAAISEDQLGAVAAVRPQATGGFGDARVSLVRGSELREGETIITGLDGEVQVLFSDQTKLVIGRGSSLVIERYLLRSNGTPEKFAVNALAGTFRFITGNGDKKAYAINTPTGSLGVRGTEFDFTVDGAGKTSVVLYEGGVILCPITGKCVTLTERCSVAQMKSRREAKVIKREADRLKIASTAFPYVVSQASLRREFRVGKPSECAGEIRTAEQHSSQAIGVLITPIPPVIPVPSSPDPEGKNNNGLGNGGEGAEGPHEQGNPGHGKNKSKNK